MKRKQFHLSPIEEEVLQQLSKKTGKSEAEIVREAIKEYGKNNIDLTNPLLKMAKEAAREEGSLSNLAVEHDKYLIEILEDGK